MHKWYCNYEWLHDGLFNLKLADGASGITGTCGTTGYSGTVTLSCVNGNLSKPPSTGCGCDTANGYSSSGGGCAKQCSITSQNGIASSTKVNVGTATINCDSSTGATGGTLTYTCNSDGTITNVTNNCIMPICAGGDTSVYTVAGETIHVFASVGVGGLGGGGNVGVAGVNGTGGSGGGIYDGNQGFLVAQEL